MRALSVFPVYCQCTCIVFEMPQSCHTATVVYVEYFVALHFEFVLHFYFAEGVSNVTAYSMQFENKDIWLRALGSILNI